MGGKIFVYHIRIMYIYIFSSLWKHEVILNLLHLNKCAPEKKKSDIKTSLLESIILHTKRHRPGGALLYAAHSPSNAWATVVRHPWFSKGEASEVGEDLNVGMFLQVKVL